MDSIRNTLNFGYNDFINRDMNRVLEQVNQNQANTSAQLQNAANQGAASLGNQRTSILNTIGETRGEVATNTANAQQNLAQSNQNLMGAFGRTPMTIGQPGGEDFSDVQPALNQVTNRGMGQLQGIAGQQNRQLGNMETDVNADINDKMQRLEGWRKDKEDEAFIRYHNQRAAIKREQAGADLERKLMLANLSALQASLNNINSVYSKAGSF